MDHNDYSYNPTIRQQYLQPQQLNNPQQLVQPPQLSNLSPFHHELFQQQPKHLPIPSNIDPKTRNKFNTKILIVDSRDRNKVLYPKPSQYIYNLVDVYHNVTEIELIQAYVPSSGYIINENNNILDITYDGTNYKIEIPLGDYDQSISPTTANLDTKINDLLSKYGLSSNMECVYDYNLSKFLFYYKGGSSSDIPNFTINFTGDTIRTRFNVDDSIYSYTQYKDNSIGTILGYDIKQYSNHLTVANIIFTANSTTSLVMKFPTLASFNSFKHILLSNDTYQPFILTFDDDDTVTVKESHITTIDAITTSTKTIELTISAGAGLATTNTGTHTGTFKFAQVIGDHVANFDEEKFLLLEIPGLDRFDSVNRTFQNSFSIVPLSDTLKYFDNSKNYGNLKIFNPILPKLDKLDINFKTFNNKYYNFNGKEHCLVFAVTYKTNIAF